MPMKPETRFKLRVQQDLKTLSSVWFLKTNEVCKIGIPDFLICLAGQFVAIEIKKDAKSKTSKLQDYNLSKIAEASGVSIVAYPENWETIFSELQAMDIALDIEFAQSPVREIPHDDCAR